MDPRRGARVDPAGVRGHPGICEGSNQHSRPDAPRRVPDALPLYECRYSPAEPSLCEDSGGGGLCVQAVPALSACLSRLGDLWCPMTSASFAASTSQVDADAFPCRKGRVPALSLRLTSRRASRVHPALSSQGTGVPAAPPGPPQRSRALAAATQACAASSWAHAAAAANGRAASGLHVARRRRWRMRSS